MQRADNGVKSVETSDMNDRQPSHISSTSLFKGAREISIEHNGEFYRLKITRQDKLILNK